MFRLPKLTPSETYREFITEFKGYNANLRINDGEFNDMENLTSDYYPVLSPRGKRKKYSGRVLNSKNEENDILFYKGFCISENHIYSVFENRLYIDTAKESSNVSTLPNSQKLFIMNEKLISWPDNKYLNIRQYEEQTEYENNTTISSTDWKTLNQKIEVTSTESTTVLNNNGFISVTLTKDENGIYPFKGVNVSTVEPENKEEKKYWLDISNRNNPTLKQWLDESSTWIPIENTYISITVKSSKTTVMNEFLNPLALGRFKIGDIVEIKGLNGIKTAGGDAFNVVDDGSYRIEGYNNNGVVIKAISAAFPDTSTEAKLERSFPIALGNHLSIERKVPLMDYMIQCNNRLWGCRYGKNDKNEPVNEIYACALGDPSNWYRYEGTSMDSYAVSIGSEGPFTGACVFGGYPYFFKENVVYKIYGTMPSNFQLVTYNCRGIQKGSADSVAIVDDIMIYKSDFDICAFDGNTPISISEALGKERYKNAAAGALNGKYYISMQDSKNKWHLFVYDVAKAMWHKEGNLHIDQFVTKGENLYMRKADDRSLIAEYADRDCFGSKFADYEDNIEWSATTGILGYELPDNKYNSRFNIRMSLSEKSSVEIFIQYDSDGYWHSVAKLRGNKLKSFTIPICPRRCDHMQIKFKGIGECKIFSLAKILEQGSDV